MVIALTTNGIEDGIDELVELHKIDARRSWLMEPEPERIKGIFDDEVKVFTKYRVEIAFQAKIMGGVPSDSGVIEGWLRSKVGVTDETEIGHMTRRVLAERFGLDPAQADFDDLVAASRGVAQERNTNGFKRDANGLYVEGRQVKAMLKEVVNICFAGEKWGPTRKGARNFFAERVFVMEDRLYLGRQEADDVEQVIGHVDGAGGRRSTLNYHEFCYRPRLTFTLMSYRDAIKLEQWKEALVLAQEEGLGALRSQGHGRFAVTEFQKL